MDACINTTDQSSENHFTSAIKRRSTSTTAGHRRRRFRFAGHVMRMAPERPARRAIQPADGRRKKRSSKEEKIYRQEESAEARKRQWQPTVCAGETCCPLFHKGPEDLSAK